MSQASKPLTTASGEPTPDSPGAAGELDAVVIGAGFGGLYMLHRLRSMGMSVLLLERGSDLGLSLIHI